MFSGIGTIGRSYLCYETPSNWNISESVFCFSPNELVSSEYLYELITSSEFVSFANSNASGAAQKGIRMSERTIAKLLEQNPELREEIKEYAKQHPYQRRKKSTSALPYVQKHGTSGSYIAL